MIQSGKSTCNISQNITVKNFQSLGVEERMSKNFKQNFTSIKKAQNTLRRFYKFLWVNL